MFISRIELLPEDETTHEHEMAKEEEAVQITADRNGVGLFKGSFRRSGDLQRDHFPGHRGPMHDPHDGVDRCPECHWELEGGHCNQCGWSVSDSDAFSDDSSDEDGSSVADHDVNFGADHGIHARHRGLFLDLDDPGASPTQSFIAGFREELYGRMGSPDSRGTRSVVTISSDVDDIDPVDHEVDPHSDAESDLPAAMGGRRHHHNYPLQFNPQLFQHPARGSIEYESDVQSTNYDDSEMGDTNLERTSETGDSDSDENESEDESEMDSFVEHDTPTHIPRIPVRQSNFVDYPTISISSEDDDESDETNTNREPSQAPTTTSTRSTTTAESATTNSNSEESSEDESRRTPVPHGRPSLKRRIILDDSDEDEDQENPKSGDSDGDESDVTTIPAQSTATRRSHLQNQRARRRDNTARRTLVSPPRRQDALPSRGGFSNGNGRQYPCPLQTASSRRGTRQTHVAGLVETTIR
jgi:hypothetical protein